MFYNIISGSHKTIEKSQTCSQNLWFLFKGTAGTSVVAEKDSYWLATWLVKDSILDDWIGLMIGWFLGERKHVKEYLSFLLRVFHHLAQVVKPLKPLKLTTWVVKPLKHTEKLYNLTDNHSHIHFT